MEKNDFEHICLFEEMVNGYYITADKAYIVRKPIFLARDEQGRLHNDQRAAIEWADGNKLYFLHGTEFNEDLFNKVISSKLNIKDILTIDNADQRAEAWRLLSPDKFLKHAKAKLIDTGARGTRLYEVPNFMDTGDTEYCMVMDDASTDRVFLEWVEPKVGKKADADLCQAVAFNITKQQYLELAAEA